jgi:hypothetical protein
MEAGSFPWGLLIIAGLIYLIWSKNSGRPWGRGFDNRFDNHQMHSGPQALFDQWHREAHQAAAHPQGGQPFATQPQAPFGTQPQPPFGTPQAPFGQQPHAPYTAQPQAPAAPAAPTAQTGTDVPGTPPASQNPPPPTEGSAGPALERW